MRRIRSRFPGAPYPAAVLPRMPPVARDLPIGANWTAHIPELAGEIGAHGATRGGSRRRMAPGAETGNTRRPHGGPPEPFWKQGAHSPSCSGPANGIRPRTKCTWTWGERRRQPSHHFSPMHPTTDHEPTARLASVRFKKKENIYLRALGAQSQGPAVASVGIGFVWGVQRFL